MSLLAALMLQGSANAALGTRPRVNVCLAAEKGASDFITKSFRLGGFDCATVYQTLGKPKLAYARFPKGDYGIILVLRFPQDYVEQGGKKKLVPNLAKIKDGVYDAGLHQLAAMIKADGRPITLRILPEFNGNWYAWGTYTTGNDPADFVPAWRHVVGLLRKETDLISFDLNYNRFNAKEGKIDHFEEWYPGDAWVDQVSISSYNRCGLQKGKGELAHSFADDVSLAYDKILTFVGPKMPIAIAETATTDNCAADKETWYRELFSDVEIRFSRIQNITFFFVEKLPGTASSDAVIAWQLENTRQYDMFKRELKDFRIKLGSEAPPEVLGVPVGPDFPQELMLPWTFWGKLEMPLYSPYDPTLSPVSHDPFETMGLRFRFRGTQDFMWNVPELSGVSVGLQTSLEGVVSTNIDRYWDNNITLGMRFLQVCDANRTVGVEWGSMCLFIEGKHTLYTVPVPSQLGNGQIDYVGAGVEFKFGGDWTHYYTGK